MIAFGRLTSFLLFVLSLSFLTCALPTPSANGNQALSARGTGNDVLTLVADLDAKVCARVEALANVKAVVDVNAQVDLLVADVKACAEAILAIGANIDVDAEIKADIAVHVAAIIMAIVRACVALVVKFGIFVLLTIFAKIDLCLQLLLLNLNVCINGIIALIAEIVDSIGAKVFVDVNLKLCLSVLGL